MKKTTKAALFAAAAAVMFSACNNSQFEGFTKADNGLYYKFFNHDESAPKVQEGDAIMLRYIITKQKNDSVVVNSKDVSRDGTGYADFRMAKSTFPGSFEDGLMMMSKGDSAEFIVPADSFFLRSMRYNELPKGFAKGEFVKAVFMVKDITPKTEVEKRQKEEMAQREAEMQEREAQEKPAIEKFLADNKITAKPTASGLYYVETKKGSGPNPKPTEIVKVHYTGKFLDGKVFDSSKERGEPVEFPLNQVIMGWTEGLQLMKKGGEAKLVIPSAMAYGPQGRQGIPPFSPLYFEVELIDIKPAPAQPEMPAAQPGHSANDGHGH
jgi:FKBP-type peptidyl-prolyl cis-trans isomerase